MFEEDGEDLPELDHSDGEEAKDSKIPLLSSGKSAVSRVGHKVMENVKLYESEEALRLPSRSYSIDQNPRPATFYEPQSSPRAPDRRETPSNRARQHSGASSMGGNRGKDGRSPRAPAA